MSADDQPHEDKRRRERREKLSAEQIRELELAGGVEGGMPAGSAGGPGERDSRRGSGKHPGDRGGEHDGDS